MTPDRSLAFAALVLLVVALVWMFGRMFRELGRDNVLKMFRDPPMLLALLGMLLAVASWLA